MSRCGSRLKPLFDRARTELFHLRSFPSVGQVDIVSIPSNLNSAADSLAKHASRSPIGTYSSLDRPALADRPVHEVESFRSVDEAGRILVEWKGFWEYEDDLRQDIQPAELFEGLLQDLLETGVEQPSSGHFMVPPGMG
jgi:hypothetical protein